MQSPAWRAVFGNYNECYQKKLHKLRSKHCVFPQPARHSKPRAIAIGCRRYQGSRGSSSVSWPGARVPFSASDLNSGLGRSRTGRSSRAGACSQPGSSSGERWNVSASGAAEAYDGFTSRRLRSRTPRSSSADIVNTSPHPHRASHRAAPATPALARDKLRDQLATVLRAPDGCASRPDHAASASSLTLRSDSSGQDE